MIAVIDYCKGNLKSVQRGLSTLGADARIVDDVVSIAQAEAIVLPGVGAFGDASETMLQTGQMEAIRLAIRKGKPFLGICLGEHLLFEQGVEGKVLANDALDDTTDIGAGSSRLPEGLQIIPGVVERMPKRDGFGVRYKVPHVGWNSIEFNENTTCPLLTGIKSGEYFYFTHSFIAPENAYTVATTTHSVVFPSVIQVNEYVFGVQFHPEKSSDAGALVLKNFLNITKRSA